MVRRHLHRVVIAAIWIVDVWQKGFGRRTLSNSFWSTGIFQRNHGSVEIIEPRRVSFMDVMIAEMQAAQIEGRAVNIDGLADLLVEGIASANREASGCRAVNSIRIKRGLNMTRDDALGLVISIAQQWGENTEEALSGGRVNPDASDDKLRDEYDVDWETAATVRDLWCAINVLQQPKQE